MEISIDGKTLAPGDDFIVYPYSAGADRTCHLRVMTKYPGPEIFNTDPATCHAVVADSLAPNEHNLLFSDLESGKIKHGALILLQQKKLTWSVARSHYRIPVLSILQYFVPASAREISMRIDEQFIGKYKVSNLGGYIRGSQIPDSFIVFSAHYDHLGMMGSSVLFPGANDNASGVSMLLNLAKYFSMNAHRPKCSVAFIAFAGEEAGLLGSEYYTGHPLFPLSKIKFLINLDLLGTGDEGMMVVNATEYPMQFHILDSLNTSGKFLPRLGERGKAKNSDHYWFTEKGVPSFFFYTLGGIQAYHDIYDRSETLPFTAYEKVFRLIVEFTSSL